MTKQYTVPEEITEDQITNEVRYIIIYDDDT